MKFNFFFVSKQVKRWAISTVHIDINYHNRKKTPKQINTNSILPTITSDILNHYIKKNPKYSPCPHDFPVITQVLTNVSIMTARYNGPRTHASWVRFLLNLYEMFYCKELLLLMCYFVIQNVRFVNTMVWKCEFWDYYFWSFNAWFDGEFLNIVSDHLNNISHWQLGKFDIEFCHSTRNASRIRWKMWNRNVITGRSVLSLSSQVPADYTPMRAIQREANKTNLIHSLMPMSHNLPQSSITLSASHCIPHTAG